MTRADFVGGLLLSAFFGATLWEGWSFQYGTEFAPGPGFAPVWLSAIGLCVSLLIAANGLWAMRGAKGERRRAKSQKCFARPIHRRSGPVLVGACPCVQNLRPSFPPILRSPPASSRLKIR